METRANPVIPAHAGIQRQSHRSNLWHWTPAFAGVTDCV
jgi:hypothetical protein